MELLAQDFHFYPNGTYKESMFYDSTTDNHYSDVVDVVLAIRIFGTQKQIDKALDEYCDKTGLKLDESYDFKTEGRGSFFYDEQYNEIVRKKMKKCHQLYKKQNNKPLILNLR